MTFAIFVSIVFSFLAVAISLISLYKVNKAVKENEDYIKRHFSFSRENMKDMVDKIYNRVIDEQ